jgi:hypothetical protein
MLRLSGTECQLGTDRQAIIWARFPTRIADDACIMFRLVAIARQGAESQPYRIPAAKAHLLRLAGRWPESAP